MRVESRVSRWSLLPFVGRHGGAGADGRAILHFSSLSSLVRFGAANGLSGTSSTA